MAQRELVDKGKAPITAEEPVRSLNFVSTQGIVIQDDPLNFEDGRQFGQKYDLKDQEIGHAQELGMGQTEIEKEIVEKPKVPISGSSIVSPISVSTMEGNAIMNGITNMTQTLQELIQVMKGQSEVLKHLGRVMAMKEPIENSSEKPQKQLEIKMQRGQEVYQIADQLMLKIQWEINPINLVEEKTSLKFEEGSQLGTKNRKRIWDQALEPEEKSRICYHCQRPGHRRSECPKRVKNSMQCFLCKEMGHIKRNCPFL